jgi:hypothetical protein
MAALWLTPGNRATAEASVPPETFLGKTGYVSGSPSVEDEWWTTSDVAAYLGVQVTTVTNYRKRGQMPAPDATVGRTHMWRPARIVEWHNGRPRPGVGGRPAGSRRSSASGAGEGA